jgi:hypothetical protein
VRRPETHGLEGSALLHNCNQRRRFEASSLRSWRNPAALVVDGWTRFGPRFIGVMKLLTKGALSNPNVNRAQPLAGRPVESEEFADEAEQELIVARRAAAATTPQRLTLPSSVYFPRGEACLTNIKVDARTRRLAVACFARSISACSTGLSIYHLSLNVSVHAKSRKPG